MQQLSLTLSLTNYIPYESSMSHLPDDMFYIKLKLIENLKVISGET